LDSHRSHPDNPTESRGPAGDETPPVSDIAATWVHRGEGMSQTVCGLPHPFGRYHIVRSLGRGGMGEVFLAHDTTLERTVALKVPFLTVAAAPEVVARFHEEARAAAHLQHPNICTVFDVGEFETIPYLTMAYVEGRTLAEVLQGGLPAQDWAAAIVYQAARALEEAHARKVVHRDLKPSNIMITGRDSPIIMDFGLARRDDRVDAWTAAAGSPVGTPAYMPPEQVLGDLQAMKHLCDVYSLGVILYELLTGAVPYTGTISEVCTQVLSVDPHPPRACRSGVDPLLEAICLRAMARRPEERFPSMADLAADLAEYLRGRSQQFQMEGGPSVCLGGSEAAQLFGRTGEALFLMGKWDAAHAVLLSAAELPGLPRDVAARQRNRLVHLCKNMDRWPEALEHSDTCLALLGTDAAPNLLTRAQINRGSVLYDLGQRPEAAALFEASLRQAQENGAALESAAAANNLGIYLHYHDELDRAEQILRLALDATDLHPVVMAYLETNLGLVLLTRSLTDPPRLDDAALVFASVLDCFRAAGHLQGTSYALSNRGVCELFRGNRARAVEDFNETVALAGRLGEKWTAYGARANLALAGMLGDDPDLRAAWNLGCDVVREAEQNSDPKGVADATLIAARAALDLAAHEGPDAAPLAETRLMLEDAVSLFARLGQRLGEAQACFGLHEVATVTGCAEPAPSWEQRGRSLLAQTALAGLPTRLLPLPWHMLLLMELF
jgi:tetratricopeptide (TPR) repeat protein